MSRNDKSKTVRGAERIPERSLLYERIIPLTLVAFGILLVAILVFSFGIIFGLIPLH